MKIKRLTIESVRGIQSLELDFSSTKVNVLLGVNGVGKSTVLSCLSVLLSKLVDQIKEDEHNPSSRLSDLLVRVEKTRETHLLKKGELKGNCLFVSDIKQPSKDLQINLSVDINEVLSSWGIVVSNDQLDSVIGDLHSVVSCMNLAEKNPPLFIAYPVSRGFESVKLKSEDKYFDTRNSRAKVSIFRVYEPESLLSKTVNFAGFFNWFRAIEDLENEERRDKSDYRNYQLNAVRDAIRVIEPEFSSLRVRRSPLRMTITKDGQEIILDNLSDGEKCLMAMVGDIARRLAIANPDHPNPLEGEGIVLIDEIELHLHPQWQRGILPKLSQTFPNCQFIVTTHSPQVVSDVSANSVFILEKDEEGNVTARHPRSSLGCDSNSILEDMMGVSRRPLDFQRDLRQLFRHIDDGNIEEARQLRQSIVTKMESDEEPELAKADVLIRRKEILGR